MGSAATGEARVRQLRKALGITQAALARRTGTSVRLLSGIEIGDRTLAPGVAVAIARALGISLGAVYGEAEISTDQSAQLEDLRTAVRRYDIPDQATAPDPAQLRAELDQAITLRDHADLTSLLLMLPRLVTQATTYALVASSPQGWGLLADAYSVVYHLAARHRWMDLVEIAPIRQAWAADQQPDPLLSVLAARSRAGTFLNYGDLAGGLTVVDRAIVTAESDLSGAEEVFATGSLHLCGMVLAGLRDDRAEAQRHIDAARAAAGEFPADVRIHAQHFGPAHTAAHVLAAEGDLGRPRHVIHLAQELTSEDTGLPPTAVADIYINTARAHLDLGERDGAQASLARAWQVAPQEAKIHPMSREVLRVLISLHRRGNPQLITLATQAGLTV